MKDNAKSLWEKYLMLTHELKKFIDNESIDTFLDLTEQRGTIVDRLKELSRAGQDDFRGTEEFQALVNEIKPLDMQIIYKARTWLNKSKRRNAAVKSYDVAGFTPVGHIVNRKY